MRKSDVTIGGTYRVKIGSRLAPVTVLSSRQRHEFGRTSTVFTAITGDTGRRIEVTAARLRLPEGATAPAVREATAAGDRAARRADVSRQEAEDGTTLARAASACGWTSGAVLGDHLDQWLDRLAQEAGEGARIEARAAILRALDADPRMPASESWRDIAAAGRRVSAGGPLTAPVAHPGAGLHRVSADRPVELPLGHNLHSLRRRMGRVHVAESLLDACRSIRGALGVCGSRRLPVPLRRGLWQAVAAIHADNRAVYRAVMGHAPLPSEGMVARAVGAAIGLPCPY